MNRRKELQEAYKQMKPDMGIFMIESSKNNKCLIEVGQNIKAKINRNKLQLDTNTHPYLELQKEWNEFGADSFKIEILETLKYDKDEAKTDYSEELAILQMEWEEKLLAGNKQFYQKKIK